MHAFKLHIIQVCMLNHSLNSVLIDNIFQLKVQLLEKEWKVFIIINLTRRRHFATLKSCC